MGFTSRAERGRQPLENSTDQKMTKAIWDKATGVQLGWIDFEKEMDERKQD
jgi:hypothetical protein